MPSLREAAAQALEALELGYDSAKAEADQYHAAMAGYRPQLHAQMDADVQQIAAAITALKAALVEDAMQKFTDVNQELQAALGCDHCNQPLYAATRCRVCGRETPIIEPEIKGDNKPVAWIHTDPDKRRVKFLEWRENEPGYRGDWIKTPLYAAPPQPEERNFCSRCGKRANGIHTCTPPAPLTDEVIAELWHQNGGFHHHFARAIERWLKGNP